ncbi:MAG: hypothetical protein HY827_10235 [Actinobacteria bacterium]|nr:hypothetical protein [Actinomycetota bacterium]
MALVYFLIAYNTTTERRQSMEEYLHADAAMRDFAAMESEYRDSEDIQVLLLTADSLDTLKSTHPHYFADSNSEGAFEVLSRS